MFSNEVRRTPLTTPEADAFFANIKVTDWSADRALGAVLRALIQPRITPGEIFTFRVYSAASGCARDARALRSTMSQFSNYENGNSLTVVDLYGGPDDNKEAVEKLVTMFPENFEDFEELDKVRAYVRKSFPCCMFLDTERRRSVVFVGGITPQRYHLLAMACPSFIPWFFKDKSLTLEEREFLKTLMQDDGNAFMDSLHRIAESFDMRGHFIRSQLSGLETRALVDKQQRLEREIANYRSSIARYNQSIAEALASIDNSETLLAGIISKIAKGEAEGDSQIMQFFLENRSINLISCDDSTLKFSVRGVLDDWNQDRAESYIRDRYSNLYRRDSELTPDQTEKLLLAIFVERTLKLHVCAAYTFAFPTSVYGIKRAKLGQYNDCYPNPHIQEFECMGNFTSVVNQYLERHNYIAAIQTCIGSCQSFNWNDATVMGHFAQTFLRDSGWNRRAIELPTGEIVTPKEAAEWLEAQEANNETANETEV